MRIKTVPSRLTTAHLRQLLADGGHPAGPAPIDVGPARLGTPTEVERLVNATGLIGLAGRQHSVGYHFAGRRVTGNTCLRSDGGLVRSIRFYGLTATAPQVQVIVQVGLAGLPAPVGKSRQDALWGAPKTVRGKDFYPRPRSRDELPGDLVADVSGPAAKFLLRPDGLNGFVLWAQEIFLGDAYPGWWHRFRPVLPQGTGPLEAATFAASLMGDTKLTEYLAAKVVNEAGDARYLADFHTELHHVQAGR